MGGPLDKLYWLRVGLGVLSGAISGLLGYLTPNPEAYRGILIAILFYIASFYYGKITVPNLPKQEAHKLTTTGLFTYIMLFLFIWILYNTIHATL